MMIFTTVMDALAKLLGNDAAMSILFGMVISLAGTQYLKFRIPIPTPLQDEYAWFIRLVSLPLGFFPVYLTWPLAHRGWIALCVGLGSPAIYKMCVAFLYWKWPALEQRLSAAPASGE